MYLLSGMPHLPYLVVSLSSLRQHWDGEVVVHAWPESYGLVERIAEDARLRIDCVKREPKLRGRNAQFLDKIALAMSLEGEVDSLLYLDADTTIHDDLAPLFDLGERFGFCATQFNDWRSSNGLPRKRVQELLKFPEIDKKLIEDATTRCWPSVNGGVWAARPGSPVLQLWHEWTLAAKEGLFIADEAVLHLMGPRFVPTGEMTIATRFGRWNSSPKFQSRHLADEDVAVWHFHGDSNVRPAKSQRGYDLWWPLYEECKRLNVGGINEWRQGVGNKWLNTLERRNQTG